MDALPALIIDSLAELRTLCERRLTLFGSAVKETWERVCALLDEAGLSPA